MNGFFSGFTSGCVAMFVLLIILANLFSTEHYKKYFESHSYIHCHGKNSFIHDPDCNCKKKITMDKK